MAQAASELRTLRDQLGDIDGRLARLSAPLHETGALIGQVKAPLALPPLIIRRLDDATVALKAVRIVTTGLSWVPGPIGAGATAASRAIAPFVASPPPPRGILGNARTTMVGLDRTIAPIRTAIEKVEKPLATLTGRIDAVHAKVLSLLAMVDRLLAHYGDHPPPGIEACAARLNAPLATFLASLTKVEATLAEKLATLSAVLRDASAALAPLAEIADRLATVLRTLGSSAFQAVLKPLRSLVAALEPWRKRGEAILRMVLGRILKSLGLSLKAIDRAFSRIVSALDPMKPISALISRLDAALSEKLAALRKALGIDALLAAVQALMEQVERDIDAFLKSACGNTLAPVTLAPVTLAPVTTARVSLARTRRAPARRKRG
jgi:hypothetical protein